MADHLDVQSLVSKARECLVAGDDKEAARLLTDAAYHTHDPAIERQVRELAATGLERAGMFGKGRWKEIIRIADVRAQRATELQADQPLEAEQPPPISAARGTR